MLNSIFLDLWDILSKAAVYKDITAKQKQAILKQKQFVRGTVYQKPQPHECILIISPSFSLVLWV